MREEVEEEVRETRELNKQRKEVLGLMESGHLSKAMNRVTSHGLGDSWDPAVLEQLQLKFPPCS